MRRSTFSAARGLAVLFAAAILTGGVSATGQRAHAKHKLLYSVTINGPTLVRSGVQCEWTSTTDVPNPQYEWSVTDDNGTTIVGYEPYLDYTFVAPPAHPALGLRVYNSSGVDESDSRVMGVSWTGPLC